MSAQRLGSFLTNVTGTSGQLLRVKTDESGLEMYTPATLPAYTITNDSTDRVINANDTNLDELADVLTTLIKDITTVIGGPVAFQWSTSEQVWPFEKSADGSILYCKEITIASVQANSNNPTAHGIADIRKIERAEGRLIRTADGYEWDPIPMAYANGDYEVALQINPTNIIVSVGPFGGVLGTRHAKIKLYYAK